MTTDTQQSQQLSNNYLSIFKLDNDKSLELKGINIIARQSDGYINLNQLCKAGGKRFRTWKENKNSKAFLTELGKSLNDEECGDKNKGAGIPAPLLIKYEINSKIDQANWGHPQIAINVAQWVSPEFNIKVSKWVFELMTTGQVTLGKELSTKELEYQNKLQTLTTSLTTSQQDYEKLRQCHNSLKFKRNYHELEKGDCVYICHNKLEPPDRYKIGKTNNISKTLRTYRRNSPYTLLDYLFYTSKMSLLEDTILNRYRSDRRPMNHEVVEEIKVETIVDDLKKIIDFVRITGSEGSLEQIEKYNDDINTPDIEVVGEGNSICIVESSDEEEYSDEDEEEILYIEEEVNEVKERIEEVEKRIEVVENKQVGMYDEILRKLEEYTDKKLKELFYQFKLPVSGVKAVKKNRIKAFLKKVDGGTSIEININETRGCDTCGEIKELNKENFREFGYGYKKRCKECDIESCKTVVGVREDVNTEINDDTETCICSKCKKVVSVDDFFKNKSNRTGRESQCKNCSVKNKNMKLNGGVLKPMRLFKRRPTNVGDNEKWCSDCEVTKKKDDFRKRKAATDGCQTYCIECDNARTRKNRMRRKILSKS